MYPLLIIREELVCLTILVFLLINGLFYKMGKDHGSFLRMCIYALGHVVFDIVTVFTVNRLDTVPGWLNYSCHVAFYLFAMLFAYEFFCYIVALCYPKNIVKKVRVFSAVVLLLYVALLPVLPVEYLSGRGTNYSFGTAVFVGYGLAMISFLASAALICVNFKKLPSHVRVAIIPMLVMLVTVECAQIVVPELLATGGGITAITVGFFFSLENPANVFKQKLLVDAYTGVKSRHSYEIDIQEMDKVFAQNHQTRYGLVFCDVNNLKAVNNIHGHLEGDAYISKIAQLLLKDMRSADSVYRMGGDEFMAVYHNVDEEIIKREIDAVHSDCEVLSSSLPYVMSVATGYAVSNEQYGNLRDVLRVADYLMYKNKAEMKKQVAFVSTDGQKLNIVGLTDRIFDAFAETSDHFYLSICNLSTNVSRWSKAAVDYFGLPGEFIFDCMTAWMEYVHPDDRDDYRADIAEVFAGHKKYHDIEYRARNKQGEYVFITCRGTILRGKNGEPDMFAATLFNHGIAEDIDPVTGLQNEHIFVEYIDDLIKNGTGTAILNVGIFSFGRINMLYGYSNGNEVLRQLVSIIKRLMRGRGRIFRMGGTKFYLCLPGATMQDLTTLYKNLQDAAMHEIHLDTLPIPLRLAGGAYMLEGNTSESSATVRNNLTYALDHSKHERHGKITFYGGLAQEQTGTDYHLLSCIHQDALTNYEGFFLAYQPILQLDSGEIVGAEALLRWQNDTFGVVGPGQFIPWLENDPCFYQLGRWILYQALHDAKEILAIQPNFIINVNITMFQLEDERFDNMVLEVLNETGFPPQNLCLELTERCRELDFEYLEAQIDFFHSYGIRVAMDDVGTGFSSLSALLQLPVDEIKLDKFFITDILNREVNQAFVHAIMDAANRLGYHCCLEGVENEATYKYLQEYHSSDYQGYYFSEPLRIDDLKKLILRHLSR